MDGIYDGRFVPDSIGIGVQAVFDQAGVTGNVLFIQESPGAPVQIHVNLMGLDQYQRDYSWSIHEFPVRTSLLRDFPCTNEKLGGVFVGSNTDMTSDGDLTGKLGNLRFDLPWQVFEDPTIDLSGPNSIIGRSLVIDRLNGVDGSFICSNIEQLGSRKETLRATFNNPTIQGDVVFHYSIGRDDALIEADIHRIDDPDINSNGNTWALQFSSGGADPCSNTNTEVSFKEIMPPYCNKRGPILC